MRIKFSILLTLFVAQGAFGTILRLTEVTQPLYLHGSELDAKISLSTVPFATFYSDPEWRFSAISTPFVPPTDGSWPAHDVNLASLYRIKVSGTYKPSSRDVLVTIDASAAAAPEGYPFTTAQVIDAVSTCVRMMFPPLPPEDGVLEIEIIRPKGGGK